MSPKSTVETVCSAAVHFSIELHSYSGTQDAQNVSIYTSSSYINNISFGITTKYIFFWPAKKTQMEERCSGEHSSVYS